MKCAVIMVTAATETIVVDESLRLGIVDYLIKPYTLQRFEEAIHTFLKKNNLMNNRATVDQATIDLLLQNRVSAAPPAELQKGLNQSTLALVLKQISEQPKNTKHTCESISASTGLSKVTVRRYLHYLMEIDKIETEVDYETGGRPRVLYKLKN